MKKKLNVIFFSISFLASIMAEAYCLVVLGGEPVSTVGMGIVVLILGYLLLDSIREQLTRNSLNIKYLLDQLYLENTDKWNERFTELLNLQKASYTAAKKNTALVDERLQEINFKLEALDMNYSSALERIADLHIKSLEGQKNALNIEVNYNKENTKLLVRTIQEELRKVNPKEQLSLIQSLLKEYQELDGLREKTKTFEDSIHGFSSEVEYREEKEVSNDSELEARSGAEIGLDHSFMDYHKDEDIESEPINRLDIEYKEEETDYTVQEQTRKRSSEDVSPMESGDEDIASAGNTQAITPLYADPNKALSPDEIAALFASFGQ